MITRALEKPKMGMEHPLGRFYKSDIGIFKIFIFRPKMAAVRMKKLRFFIFWSFFHLNGRHFVPKNENFKNSNVTFIKPLQGMLHTDFWLLKFSGYQKKFIFIWKFDLIWTIFFTIGFPMYFPTFAKVPFTVLLTVREPLGVEKWLSPFWKLETWGYKICANEVK